MTKNKVVLVSFPFDDLSSSKVRTAVCLTDPIGPYRHVVLAFITSHISESPLETDILLTSADPTFQVTGLHVSSMLQLHRLLTVTTSIIQRRLGELPAEFQGEVESKLKRLFRL